MSSRIQAVTLNGKNATGGTGRLLAAGERGAVRPVLGMPCQAASASPLFRSRAASERAAADSAKPPKDRRNSSARCGLPGGMALARHAKSTHSGAAFVTSSAPFRPARFATEPRSPRNVAWICPTLQGTGRLVRSMCASPHSVQATWLFPQFCDPNLASSECPATLARSVSEAERAGPASVFEVARFPLYAPRREPAHCAGTSGLSRSPPSLLSDFLGRVYLTWSPGRDRQVYLNRKSSLKP